MKYYIDYHLPGVRNAEYDGKRYYKENGDIIPATTILYDDRLKAEIILYYHMESLLEIQKTSIKNAISNKATTEKELLNKFLKTLDK